MFWQNWQPINKVMSIGIVFALVFITLAVTTGSGNYLSIATGILTGLIVSSLFAWYQLNETERLKKAISQSIARAFDRRLQKGRKPK